MTYNMLMHDDLHIKSSVYILGKNAVKISNKYKQ